MRRATVYKLSNRNRWTQLKDHGDALSWCMKSVSGSREYASLAVSVDHAVHLCLNYIVKVKIQYVNKDRTFSSKSSTLKYSSLKSHLQPPPELGSKHVP